MDSAEKSKAFENSQSVYAKVVVKAWTDDAFRARLMADPEATLKAEGFDLPENMDVAVLEGSTKWVFPLPPKPEAALGGNAEEAALGYSSSTCCCSG